MAEEVDIRVQLNELMTLFAEAKPTDSKMREHYAWIICKVLNRDSALLGSVQCRRLLAEYMRLDMERPSKLHSAMLASAVKVASAYSDFHFIPFINMWGLENLRDEDYEQQKNNEGKVFPSLADRVGRTYVTASLMRPDEKLSDISQKKMDGIIVAMGLHKPIPMVVSRIVEMTSGTRKVRFASLVAVDGTEATCELHGLMKNPTVESNANVRHFVNVGQLYDVILKEKSSSEGRKVFLGLLSQKRLDEVFPCCVGYVEHIDVEHRHIHIYDNQSRHFVSSGQKVSPKVGQYVKFVPVVPAKNKFKSAIILSYVAASDGPIMFGIRELVVTYINKESGYISWDLADKEVPIVELGTEEPTFTGGYIPTNFFVERNTPIPEVGRKLKAILFLKRGKNLNKHPYIVQVIG